MVDGNVLEVSEDNASDGLEVTAVGFNDAIVIDVDVDCVKVNGFGVADMSEETESVGLKDPLVTPTVETSTLVASVLGGLEDPVVMNDSVLLGPDDSAVKGVDDSKLSPLIGAVGLVVTTVSPFAGLVESVEDTALAGSVELDVRAVIRSLELDDTVVIDVGIDDPTETDSVFSDVSAVRELVGLDDRAEVGSGVPEDLVVTIADTVEIDVSSVTDTDNVADQSVFNWVDPYESSVLG